MPCLLLPSLIFLRCPISPSYALAFSRLRLIPCGLPLTLLPRVLPSWQPSHPGHLVVELPSPKPLMSSAATVVTAAMAAMVAGTAMALVVVIVGMHSPLNPPLGSCLVGLPRMGLHNPRLVVALAHGPLGLAKACWAILLPIGVPPALLLNTLLLLVPIATMGLTLFHPLLAPTPFIHLTTHGTSIQEQPTS